MLVVGNTGAQGQRNQMNCEPVEPCVGVNVPAGHGEAAESPVPAQAEPAGQGVGVERQLTLHPAHASKGQLGVVTLFK